MRDRFALLNAPALRTQAEAALAAVGTVAIRNAAVQLREDAKALPAPCGCTPAVRCDRHCRATIRPGRDPRGNQWWRLTCNGKGAMAAFDIHGPHHFTSYSLPKVHTAAAEHVARHRLLAFTRTK